MFLGLYRHDYQPISWRSLSLQNIPRDVLFALVPYLACSSNGSTNRRCLYLRVFAVGYFVFFPMFLGTLVKNIGEVKEDKPSVHMGERGRSFPGTSGLAMVVRLEYAGWWSHDNVTNVDGTFSLSCFSIDAGQDSRPRCRKAR